MVALDWRQERTAGVTLVALYLTAERERRVRVENRLDGPVWPPRRRGQPAAGWDEDGFEGIVEPGERLALGYATPARPAEPPAEIVADEPASAETADEAIEQTPAGVVRSLGDALVPRDAVPVPDDERVRIDERTNVGSAVSDPTDGEQPDGRGANVTGDGAGDSGRESQSDVVDDRRGTDTDAAAIPPAIECWFRGVERRLSAADRTDREASSTGSWTAADERRALVQIRRRADRLLDRTDRAESGPSNGGSTEAGGAPAGER